MKTDYTITRTINGEEVTIQLTPREVERIHRAADHEYLIEDIRSHIAENPEEDNRYMRYVSDSAALEKIADIYSNFEICKEYWIDIAIDFYFRAEQQRKS